MTDSNIKNKKEVTVYFSNKSIEGATPDLDERLANMVVDQYNVELPILSNESNEDIMKLLINNYGVNSDFAKKTNDSIKPYSVLKINGNFSPLLGSDLSTGENSPYRIGGFLASPAIFDAVYDTLVDNDFVVRKSN